ncbi:hypothetical protein MMC13_000969 [Lambiella insularis]|nr:hypothetical protein [Lambiella insularis]
MPSFKKSVKARLANMVRKVNCISRGPKTSPYQGGKPLVIGRPTNFVKSTSHLADLSMADLVAEHEESMTYGVAL